MFKECKILLGSLSLIHYLVWLSYTNMDRSYCILCASFHLNISIEEASLLRLKYLAEIDSFGGGALFMCVVFLILLAFIICIDSLGCSIKESEVNG